MLDTNMYFVALLKPNDRFFFFKDGAAITSIKMASK